MAMYGHTWKIGHHRKEGGVTIFGNKQSNMVPGGTEHAAEWLQSVRSYLMAMRWAFESSKSIKRVKRYAIIMCMSQCHVPMVMPKLHQFAVVAFMYITMMHA